MTFFSVEIKPYEDMRYPTLGDYYVKDRVLHFDIADTGNNSFNACILLHEIFEYFATQGSGILLADIDQWDMDHLASDDPGSLPGCPYIEQHKNAEKIEKLACKLFGHTWNKYNKILNKLL